MGVCVSKKSSSSSSSSGKKSDDKVKVIWISGKVGEYREGVRAEEVLGTGESMLFICSSDSLYLDQPITPLSPWEELSCDQIYFVLDHTKRQRPLSAADMAALALRATTALGINKKSRSRIVPLSESFNHPPHYDYHQTVNIKNKSPAKLHRLASRRAKMAVRSFRLRLSTIYESS